MMNEYFEIAYATVNDGLCVFTGTGFSMAVSDSKAPSWQKLLEEACDRCKGGNALKKVLFPKKGTNPVSLDEAAQIVALELQKEGKDLHAEIADIIKQVKLGGSYSSIQKFCESQSFKAVTTNYDKLLEQLCGEERCQTLTPGLPIPRSNAPAKIYHVHGSIDVPDNMVLTADDYFNFMNSESYFSRKLSTILHENTIVIMGYSLGDTNLKAILSAYRGFTKSHTIGSNIFLVSRNKVNQWIKDYYSTCYGIRVLDELEIDQLFSRVQSEIKNAKDCQESSVTNIKKVVDKNHHFTSKFLKLERSFYEIVLSISAAGYSLERTGVVKMFGRIISDKSTLTGATGAWEQYDHLANWLIYLGSLIDLRNTSIKDTYLTAAQRSMETMSKDYKYGYSWSAFKSWSSKWPTITPDNRKLISDYIRSNSVGDDALLIVANP